MIDSEKTGKADLHEIIYGGFGFNDTHGMTGEFQQGFDGWIYACHGYSNTSNVKGKDGKVAITMTRQHLSLQARRLEDRAMDLGPGQSVRPGVRSLTAISIRAIATASRSPCCCGMAGTSASARRTTALASPRT